MFYDLEDPITFARQIHDSLDDNGVWHFEQSYMPSMLRMKSYRILFVTSIWSITVSAALSSRFSTLPTWKPSM